PGAHQGLDRGHRAHRQGRRHRPARRRRRQRPGAAARRAPAPGLPSGRPRAPGGGVDRRRRHRHAPLSRSGPEPGRRTAGRRSLLPRQHLLHRPRSRAALPAPVRAPALGGRGREGCSRRPPARARRSGRGLLGERRGAGPRGTVHLVVPEAVSNRPRLHACTRAVALTVLALALSGPAAARGDRRYALIIGNDSGDGDTRPLLYAGEDARRIHDVLTRYGFVSPDNAFLLVNRRTDDLQRALSDLQMRAAQAHQQGDHTALVVYYSGHAKDGALRLGESRIGLDELKVRLQKSGADVVVGIFDSCRSGVVTRSNGARHAHAFDVQANAYAYARTVADTAESAAGAQHPTFSYDLKGNGDLVLTEPGGYHESLLVPAAAPAGTYYIVRGDVIAAEVVKAPGESKRIALRPDRYVVKRRLADRLRIGPVNIAQGSQAVLDESRLRDVPFSDDPVKGAR